MSLPNPSKRFQAASTGFRDRPSGLPTASRIDGNTSKGFKGPPHTSASGWAPRAAHHQVPILSVRVFPLRIKGSVFVHLGPSAGDIVHPNMERRLSAAALFHFAFWVSHAARYASAGSPGPLQRAAPRHVVKTLRMRMGHTGARPLRSRDPLEVSFERFLDIVFIGVNSHSPFG